MIQVTKSEAKKIRETLPGVSIKRTVNKYYVEDIAKVCKLLGRSTPRQEAIQCR